MHGSRDASARRTQKTGRRTHSHSREQEKKVLLVGVHAVSAYNLS